MTREEIDYSEYSVSQTYSVKIKNAKKIDEIAEREEINKSQALNKIIEKYPGDTKNGK
jgi:hypothetical protein